MLGRLGSINNGLFEALHQTSQLGTGPSRRRGTQHGKKRVPWGAVETISEQKRTKGSIEDYFSKLTKLETSANSEGTELVASKVFCEEVRDR